MDEPVNRRQRHRWTSEDFAPIRERRICGYRDAFALVALRDEFEQHGRLVLITRT